MNKVLKYIADALGYIALSAVSTIVIGWCIYFINQHLTCVDWLVPKLCVIH